MNFKKIADTSFDVKNIDVLQSDLWMISLMKIGS